jgi:hypothetical protein
MPIPQAQLDIWSHQGAITTSAAAYASVRTALLAARSPLSGRGVEIYLHGSYANDTNTYADGDVDIVVLYDKTFYKDMSALAPFARVVHEATFGPATYTWSQLREDVLSALRLHFGTASVRPGKKTIKVRTASGRKEADVLPAVQFRRYASFVDANNLLAHWGIQFFDSAGNAIVAYPKYHIERGAGKSSPARTGGKYKPTVRVFKNLRNYLLDNHLLADGVAPSYLIECALHNVPDHLFRGSFTSTIPAILGYLLHTPYAGFLCQNGVTTLIGTGLTQWPENNFAQFVVTANEAWQNW